MRADGKKLKNLDAMSKAMPMFMPHRYDTMNMITLDIPLEPLREYVNKRRKTSLPVSHLAIIIAAFVRVVSQYPELNRFVVNKKFYARNEITVSMVVMKNANDHGEMNKMYFEPDDTIDDVVRKINKYIEENRDEEGNNSTDKALNILSKVPGLFSAGVNVIKFIDKHGLLPKGVINASPFHASMLITNLSSIRTNHIYHHIYDFGTTSLFLAIGKKERIQVVGNDGTVKTKKVVRIKITVDERICDGQYFAESFRMFRRLLKKPEQLEVPPSEFPEDTWI